MAVLLNGTNGLIQAYDYQVPTTGFSYTFVAGTQTLVMNPAGTLATGTITMPASPSDGMTITFSTTQQITALTLSGNTGQTIVGGVNSLAATQAVSFIYRSANTSWFPMTTQVGEGAGPAFAATGSSAQTFGATTWTKIVFQTETYDTNSCYDNATNYRFTPTVAGYYQMNLSMSAAEAGAGGVVLYTSFYRNGVAFTSVANRDDNGQSRNMSQSVVIYCNGSTDYIEVYGYTSGGTFAVGSARYFSGAMVRAA